jgi:hypothetical protein
MLQARLRLPPVAPAVPPGSPGVYRRKMDIDLTPWVNLALLLGAGGFLWNLNRKIDQIAADLRELRRLMLDVPDQDADRDQVAR